MCDVWHRLQVIIQARKPEFFNYPSMSLFEIVTQDGLMRPCFNARKVPAKSADAPVHMRNTLGCSGVTLAAALAALLMSGPLHTAGWAVLRRLSKDGGEGAGCGGRRHPVCWRPHIHRCRSSGGDPALQHVGRCVTVFVRLSSAQLLTGQVSMFCSAGQDKLQVAHSTHRPRAGGRGVAALSAV